MKRKQISRYACLDDTRILKLFEDDIKPNGTAVANYPERFKDRIVVIEGEGIPTYTAYPIVAVNGGEETLTIKVSKEGKITCEEGYGLMTPELEKLAKECALKLDK